MGFFTRLKLAFSVLFGGDRPASQPSAPALPPPPAPAAKALPPSSHVEAKGALFLLGLLQREGRLLDFVKDDISAYSDADIGAAARVVHSGCRKVIAQYLAVTPVVKDEEGSAVSVSQGFDASRFRLTGNVTGQGPWKGSLKHHGWEATKIDLPPAPETVDVKVIAPAEVELP